MKSDAAKDFALDACKHWLELDVPDMQERLPVGLTLETWSAIGADEAQLMFRALPGFNFESWAHRKWKWDGKFKIHVSWLPPGEDASTRIVDCSYENDYEIEKRTNQRPWVFDLKHGNFWAQAGEE
jgi:hypothetical protein